MKSIFCCNAHALGEHFHQQMLNFATGDMVFMVII